MNNNPLDNKPQSEIDILALFEYFKNGIKSIFKGIARLFVWLFRQITDLLYVIYRNWLLFLVLMLLFALLGVYKTDLLANKYKYEMVVQPQMNSNYELYDQIAGLEQIIRNDLEPKEGLEGLSKIQITPIKRLSDEVRLYYEIPKNTMITGSPDMFGYERDTVFYRAMEFKDFKEEISAQDYPLQKISVNSKEKLNLELLEDLILQPFSESEFWNRTKAQKINRLEAKANIYQGILNRSDSLLSAYAKMPNQGQSSEIRISGRGTENNVEYDILRQMQFYSDGLENIQVELNNSQEVVRVLSPLKIVEDDSFRSYLNPFTGLLIGFILSLLILLMKRILKYLKHYQANT